MGLPLSDQKCRFNWPPLRFIVREFVYSQDEIQKQRQELDNAGTTEKELWVCPDILSTFASAWLTGTLQTELLSVSRINFSEAFQILVHLKVVRLFVESVLRYGLPANYTGLVINASKLKYHIQYRSDPSWIFTAGSQVRKEGFQRPSISVRLPSTAFKPKPGQEASSERGLCWRIHFFDGPGVL